MAMEHGLVERNTKLLPNRDRDAIPGPAYGVAMMFLSRKKITMPDFVRYALLSTKNKFLSTDHFIDI